jgi:uncharacterized protein YpmS
MAKSKNSKSKRRDWRQWFFIVLSILIVLSMALAAIIPLLGTN